MIRETLKSLKAGTEYLNHGREIVAGMARRHADHAGEEPMRVLDVGFGSGADLLNVRHVLAPRRTEIYGIDILRPHVDEGTRRGIVAYRANIETERLPFDDRTFDIVIVNQLIEHTKEIFWLFSEISRVMKPNGSAIIGTSNLAALHCRVLLLFGEQPSCVELLGPHVRGITRPSFERFITADGYFRLVEVKGSGFYPFPAALARLLSRIAPTFAVGLFMRIVRTEKPGAFIDVLKTRFFETNYVDKRTQLDGCVGESADP